MTHLDDVRTLAAHHRAAQREEERWRGMLHDAVRVALDAGETQSAVAEAANWHRQHVQRLVKRASG